MDSQNICKFNIANDDGENIGILNFCHEKYAPHEPRFTMNAVFRLHLVARGSGTFGTLNNSTKLKAGDVFITYPSTDYYIVNDGGLEFLYISFVGLRSYKLIERAEIPRGAAVRGGFEKLIELWERSVEFAETGNIDLVAEGLLLFTIGRLCSAREDKSLASKSEKIVLTVKKQMEERFCDPALNLNMLCEENYYNAKYVSSAFKKYMGIGFSEYLTSLRLNNSQRLINSGFKSVKQIAALSGFEDALYFSKLYKRHNGISPAKAIESWK